MLVDLSSVPPEKSQLFLDHLRAQLPYSTNLTIAIDDTNDRFEEDFYTQLEPIEGEPYTVQVSVRWDRIGRLTEVWAIAESEGWESHFASCVRTALSATLENRTESFPQNEVFAFIGSPLLGEYQFGSYRIAQISPFEPSVRIPVEHAVELGFSVKAPDRVRADQLSFARADDLMAVLGLLLGTGFYRFRHERLWTVSSDGSPTLGRHAYEPAAPRGDVPRSAHGMAAGPITDVAEGRYQIPAHLVGGEHLTIWSDTGSLIDAFQLLPLEDREQFLCAARLFRLALTAGRHHTTLRLAYQVSALDVLRAPGRSSRDAFVGLVEELVPGSNKDEMRDAYGRVRSAHFHAGRLVAVDRESPRHHAAPFVGGHHGEAWMRLERTLWLALVAWLRRAAVKPPRSQELTSDLRVD